MSNPVRPSRGLSSTDVSWLAKTELAMELPEIERLSAEERPW
ncbi:MAG: hypothetical protein U1F57_00385 [bacterium]